MDIRRALRNNLNPILVINGVITRAQTVMDISKMIGSTAVRVANREEIERYLKIESKTS